MYRSIRHLVIALLLLTLPSPAPAQMAENRDRNKAAQTLHALFNEEWDYQLEHHPQYASLVGDPRWNDRWPDVSLEAIRKGHEHDLETLARLRRIDRDQLPRADQLNYDLFREQYQHDVELYEYRWYLLPVTQRQGSIQTISEIAGSMRFTTTKDYEDWIARLRAFPAYMDQTIGLMREGMRARMMFPKVVMQRVTAQIDRQIVADPQASPFYQPFKRFPDSLTMADRERLAVVAREAIDANVIPAFRRFRHFFVNEYLPASFDQVGVWQMPRGEQLYAFFVRKQTTTNLIPQEIHELGLSEVKRIRAEMQGVMDKVGFKGTLSEFFTYLRTDPGFYYKTSDELLQAFRATAKRIDPNLVKLFKTLPRTPYGVEPMPALSAPDTTGAYYQRPADDGSRAGTLFINLYRPETRPRYSTMVSTLHEAVPGHHLQEAREMELGEVPVFRRYADYNAFIEGWAFYAESLGDEMGLYDDPYSKFGQLNNDMWRAVRLVVDTGIHQMHWTREQAINYFKENVAEVGTSVENEVDRYIVWPGQALAYKVGQLKIRQLRERARSELGPNFDVREFHDVVLGSGAVPLDILERNVVAWIAEQKRRGGRE